MTKQLLLLFYHFLISGVTAQTVNSIYVSDAGNFSSPPWQILKYNEDGSEPEVFISDSLGWPQDILFVEDSNFVLISNLNTGKINRHDINTGEFISTFAEGIGGPTRMKIGPDGNLYVLQWTGTGYVKKYDLGGNDLGDFTSTGVPQSIGLDWDTDGNLYVSSYGGDFVRKFDTDGNDLGLFINTYLIGPTNIWFMDNGDLLVLDYDGGAVKRFDSDGNYLLNFIGGTAQAEGIDTLDNGNILVGNGGTAAVKMYTSDGAYLSDLIPEGSGGLLRPNAIVVRKTGTVGISPNLKSEIQVYPTIGESFTITQSATSTEQLSVRIYNMVGKLVDELNLSKIAVWNAVSMAAGTYILEFIEKDRVLARQQIIVQHQ